MFEPIAVTYHVSGVSSLNLDGPTIARIFNGGITKWDDPAIKALNAGTNLPVDAHSRRLPQRPIRELIATSSNTSMPPPTAPGAKAPARRSTAVSVTAPPAITARRRLVQSTDGSITYNEWSFAVGNQLNMAQIITSAGPDPVSITTESVGKTIAGARPSRARAMTWWWTRRRSTSRRSPVRTRLCEVTYEIVCSKYPDSATGDGGKGFHAGRNRCRGQSIGLDQYGSIPLPELDLPIETV